MKRRDLLLNGTGALASAFTLDRSFPLFAQAQPPADYTIRIAPIRLEIAPRKIVETTAFNGLVPGRLIRVSEGRHITIDVVNETDVPDIVHWHGLQIPSVQRHYRFSLVPLSRATSRAVPKATRRWSTAIPP
jgi:FtsP/CotA-like multicopper oxidase with cupredoxin domain